MADGMNVDELLVGLASLGFELEDCQLAVEAGNSTIESAVEWLVTKRNTCTPGQDVTVQKTTVESSQSGAPNQVPSTSYDGQQPSASLSSRYTISEKHQKSKEQFIEKERENARMEAKRRKLMDKMARQEILQQIAEDRELRRRRNQDRFVTHAACTESSTSNIESVSKSTERQCILQIRGPSGTVKREKFSPDAKLQDVVTFTCNQYHLKSDRIQLLQPFPHRVFSVAEMASSLAELGLSPGGSVVVRKIDSQTSTSPDRRPPTDHHTDSVSTSEASTAETTDLSSSTLPVSHRNLPFIVQNNDNDVDNASEPHGEQQHEAEGPPLFDRDPPPELQGNNGAPPHRLDPHMFGAQMFVDRQQGHMWGEGMRLGAVERNPHDEMSVLTAQNPRESALRRLEMQQHQQLEREAGSSQGDPVEQAVLHREVPCLTDLCIHHVTNRLPGHQHPISSLGVLPHDLCDKILSHLMKNKTLNPKSMQTFVSCGLRYVKLDCYPLVTNELLIALRLHRHLTHLSLRACPLITDKALEAVKVLKKLKSLNLSQCQQLTDKCFVYIKELPSLTTLCMDMTKVTDQGVCYFLRNSFCCPSLVQLSLHGTSISDQSLDAMSVLKALKILDVGSSKVTSLEIAQQLHQLESLNVAHTAVQNSSLLPLVDHPSLVSLSLLSTSISDEGLNYLKGLQLMHLKLPDRLKITDKGVIGIQGLPLVALDLSDYIHVTDTGVQSIAHMTRLTQLSLSNTKLTDEGIQTLSALSELEELNVDRTVVTNDGCTVLSSLHKLRILGLSSTRISNKLLINGILNSCKNLTRLNLSRTRISDKGLLHMMLPMLAQLNLDWTRVTVDCLGLLKGCPALKALRASNCSPPSQDSDDSDEEQLQQQN